MMDIAALIGRPYAPGARGPDAFDCWGLVVHVLASGFAVAAPDVARTDCGLRAARRLFDEHAGNAGWLPTPVPSPGAVALMGTAGRPAHAGIAIADGARLGVLHALEREGVVFDALTKLPARGFTFVSWWKAP